MNRTLVLARVFPPRVGGSGRWMWELYSRMPCDEFVIAAGEDAGATDFDRAHDLRTVRLPLDLRSWGAMGLRRGADYLRAYQRLSSVVRDCDVRAIHAACPLPEGFLAWMLHRRFGLPYLLYVHGEELNVARTSRELSWMTRRVLQGANAVVANSHNTARLLEVGWPVEPERLQVLHPGVDTTRFQPAARDEAARSVLGWGDRPVILTTGRLQKRKGHAQLLRALPAIRHAVPDVLFAIVGDGHERDRLKQIAADHDLRQSVIFHGELDGGELVRAYQQCDLFALPNYEADGDIEGFGMVLLEAQACGKPVIAGDSGGTAETMDAPRTGLVLDCADVALLGTTIQNLLQDTDRRGAMGQFARQWTLDHFDWDKASRSAREVFGAVGHVKLPTRIAAC